MTDTTRPAPVNQCDGCAQGLELRGWSHYKDGLPWMRCAGVEYAPPAPAAPAPDASRVPNDDEVICPGCTHQFRAVPVNVQATIAAQAREIAEWRTWGIAEIAVRNQSVMEYMKHWEGRAERAEADLAAARADAERFQWMDGWLCIGDRGQTILCFPNGIQIDGEMLDDLRAAIDAARSAAKGDGNG